MIRVPRKAALIPVYDQSWSGRSPRHAEITQSMAEESSQRGSWADISRKFLDLRRDRYEFIYMYSERNGVDWMRLLEIMDKITLEHLR